MKFNKLRLFPFNQRAPAPGRKFVLYWMQIQRRLEYNFALDYAVAWANELNLPLLIFEGLSSDYPWASARFQQFLLQGMRENQIVCEQQSAPYFAFVDRTPIEGKGLIRALAAQASIVITDAFPGFVIREHNEKIGPGLDAPFIAVDSNGIIPLGASTRAPYSAYEFRRLMQKLFVEEYTNPPKRYPLKQLKQRRYPDLRLLHRRWPETRLENVNDVLISISLDRSIPALSIEGTRKAAISRLKHFVQRDLEDYVEMRNHPDLNKTSGLSPYLHFGKISAHEVVSAVLKAQPEGWSTERIFYNKGSREGFFQGHPFVDAFLDQLITWREAGYHYCHHVRDFDRYESLPEWARRTLERHAKDRREHVYTFEEFENAQSHDSLWNAAQNQLRREGVIHNYLRMLWGKKILEWSRSPREALSTMIELNNKYAIDGRDPNSYSGIFWVLGRFDRPWGPEREIFGAVRYMSSENTARKIKVKEYVRRYAAPDSR